jgi:tetratricopeptide (TPR) repeat protein
MYMTSTYERLTGTFYWANPAAAYLIPAVVIAVDKLRRSWGKLEWFWGAVVVLFGSTFMLANSRAATLALALVLGLYLLAAPTPRRFWIKIVFSFVLAIGASYGVVSMSTLIVHKSNAVTPGGRVAATGESNSGRDRLSYLESAFEMWVDRPLGGVGAGAYGDVHPEYQQRVVSASRDAHNVYVQTLAELGLIGAVALSAVLLWLIVGAVRGMAANPELVAVVLGLVGLLLHAALDVDAAYPALLMLAAVLFGTAYQQWWPARGRAGWRWPALAALLLVPLVSLYQSDAWAAKARAAQEDGDYPAAAANFGEAHRGVLTNPDYINAEGIALYAVATGGGKDARAAGALALDRARESQKLDPHDGQHHQLAGRVLALRGDQKGAEVELRRALELDPYNHPEYGLDLADLQLGSGDTAGSRKTAQAMLKLYPVEVINNRNLDKTLRPTVASLEALVGNTYLREGKLQEAGAAAGRALKLDSQNLRGRALKVQVDKLSRQ